MPCKPCQLVLNPYDREIHDMLARGMSFQAIAVALNSAHGMDVTHNAVFTHVNANRHRHQFHQSFMAGLDDDIRDDLWRQLVAQWTHDSTAIEGNTLTLDETIQVLQFGLTISGKPAKDHEEILGHGRAIDLLYQLIEVKAVTEDHLFDLHRAVMPKVAVDPMKPVGGWKRDYNGTTGQISGESADVEYARPADVPALMERWLEVFNKRLDRVADKYDAVDSYVWSHMTFARIHPFFDGNGRIARLLSNLPLLRNGFPPITIATENRPEYILALGDYQVAVGKLTAGSELLPDHKQLSVVKEFVAGQWIKTTDMLSDAKVRQRERCRIR